MEVFEKPCCTNSQNMRAGELARLVTCPEPTYKSQVWKHIPVIPALWGGGQEQEDPWNSLANQLSGITELLSPVKDPISKTEQRKGLGGVEGGEAAIGM